MTVKEILRKLSQAIADKRLQECEVVTLRLVYNQLRRYQYLRLHTVNRVRVTCAWHLHLRQLLTSDYIILYKYQTSLEFDYL